MAHVVPTLSPAIAFTLALVAVNGVFVAAEFAIVRVRRMRFRWRAPTTRISPLPADTCTLDFRRAVATSTPW